MKNKTRKSNGGKTLKNINKTQFLLTILVVLATFLILGINTTFAAVTVESCDSALLNGSIGANQSNVAVGFEWGASEQTVSSGNGTKVNLGLLSSGSTKEFFSHRLTGLTQNTTYFFRAMATQNSQTNYGIVEQFTTKSCQTTSTTNPINVTVTNPNPQVIYYPYNTSIPTGTTVYVGSGSGNQNNSYNNNAPIVYTKHVSDIYNYSAILHGAVDTSGIDTNVWFQWGTDHNLGNSTNSISKNSYYSYFDSTVKYLQPYTTYYFRAVAQNYRGTSYGNISSFTTGAIVSTTPINYQADYTTTPVAITKNANQVYNHSARLNSQIFTSNNYNAITWFEWRNSNSETIHRTQEVTINANISAFHAETIRDLDKNTTYYFRAVAKNNAKVYYGDTLSFTTGNNEIVKNTIKIKPPVETIITKTIIREPETEVTPIPRKMPEKCATNANGLFVASISNILPGNLIGWLVLIILVLIIVILVKQIRNLETSKKINQI